MSNGLRSRLIKDSVAHGKSEILLQLARIYSAMLSQRKIVDDSCLRNKVRDLEVADISHGTDELKLIRCELVSPTCFYDSQSELTDVKDDSIRHSCGPVTKSYNVFAALRKSFLARCVISSPLGNEGRACVSNASLLGPFVARNPLIVLADWRQSSASASRSVVAVSMVERE